MRVFRVLPLLVIYLLHEQICEPFSTSLSHFDDCIEFVPHPNRAPLKALLV